MADARTCAGCGATLPTPPPGRRGPSKWCSTRCANNDAQRRRRARVPRAPLVPVEKRCAWCDRTYSTTRYDGRYCSNSCHMYGSGRARLEVKLKWRVCKTCDTTYCHGSCPHQSDHPRKPPPDMTPRPCHSCGVPFVPPCLSAHFAVYCSKRCNRREAASRHRIARRGSPTSARVNRWRIYVRDQWTCQLCGKKVPRDAQVPHPLARTLDHILPASQGGAHTEANLQLAHFGCNSLKRDNAWNGAEQLRML
jgi:hypothetical protein